MPKSALLVLVSLLAHVALLAPPSAHAEPPKAPVDPAARSAFEAGADAYDHGRFAEALREFERAYQLSPHPKLLFNIGRAADGDGQGERAISAYNAYLLAFPNAENREFVQSRIAKLSAQTAPPVASTAPTAGPLAPANVAAAELANQRAAPLAPAPAEPADGRPPFWKKGWFWGVVGAVVVGAVTAGVVVAVHHHGDNHGGKGPPVNEHVQTLGEI